MQKSLGRDTGIHLWAHLFLVGGRGERPWFGGRGERRRGCILASLPILFCIFCQDFYRFSAFFAFLEDPGQLGCAEGPGVAFLHLCQCFSAFFVKISIGFLHFLHFLHFCSVGVNGGEPQG